MIKKCLIFAGIFSMAFFSLASAATKSLVVPMGSVDKNVEVAPSGTATKYDVKTGKTFSSQAGINVTGVLVETAKAGDAAAADVVKGITFSNATSIDLTGTYVATPVPKTGQSLGYTLTDVGEDGDLTKGTAWPNPRFTKNGNGTVTDNLTGLVWLEDANCLGSRPWIDDTVTPTDGIFTAVAALANGHAACALTDGSTAGQWRVPNVRELTSLISYYQYSTSALLPDTAGTGSWSEGDPFTNVQSSDTIFYWTSTTRPDSSYAAFGISMYLGAMEYYTGKQATTNPVWAVRNQ